MGTFNDKGVRSYRAEGWESDKGGKSLKRGGRTSFSSGGGYPSHKERGKKTPGTGKGNLENQQKNRKAW